MKLSKKKSYFFLHFSKEQSFKMTRSNKNPSLNNLLDTQRCTTSSRSLLFQALFFVRHDFLRVQPNSLNLPSSYRSTHDGSLKLFEDRRATEERSVFQSRFQQCLCKRREEQARSKFNWNNSKVAIAQRRNRLKAERERERWMQDLSVGISPKIARELMNDRTRRLLDSTLDITEITFSVASKLLLSMHSRCTSEFIRATVGKHRNMNADMVTSQARPSSYVSIQESLKFHCYSIQGPSAASAGCILAGSF